MIAQLQGFLVLQGKSPHGRQGDETCIAGMFDRATKTTITKVSPKGMNAKQIGEYLRKWVLKHTVENAIVITGGELEYRPLKNMNRRHFYVQHTNNEYVRDELIEDEIVEIRPTGLRPFGSWSSFLQDILQNESEAHAAVS